METPILDEEIRRLKKLKKTNDLSFGGEQKLKEFEKIKSFISTLQSN